MWDIVFFHVTHVETKEEKYLCGTIVKEYPSIAHVSRLFQDPEVISRGWTPSLESNHTCAVLSGPFCGTYDSYADFIQRTNGRVNSEVFSRKEKIMNVYVGEPSLMKDFVAKYPRESSPEVSSAGHQSLKVQETKQELFFSEEAVLSLESPVSPDGPPIPPHIKDANNPPNAGRIARKSRRKIILSSDEEDDIRVQEVKIEDQQREEANTAYLFRLHLPPSSTQNQMRRSISLFYKRDSLPDILTLKLAAFKYLCENQNRRSRWQDTPEDQADFVMHYEARVEGCLYEDWFIKQKNGKAQETLRNPVHVDVYFETVQDIPSFIRSDSASAARLDRRLLFAQLDAVTQRRRSDNFIRPGRNNAPTCPDHSPVVHSVGVRPMVDLLHHNNRPAEDGKGREREEAALASCTISPEEERWSYYGNRQKKENNQGKLKESDDFPGFFSNSSFSPPSRPDITAIPPVSRLFRPPPPTSGFMAPGSMSMIRPNSYPVPRFSPQSAPWAIPSAPLLPSGTASPHPLYFEFHVIDFHLKPIGPDPWVFSELPITDILRTMLGHYIGRDSAQTSRLSVINDKIHTEMLYEKFITAFWDGQGGWECYRRGQLTNHIHIQVWSSGEFAEAQTVPPLANTQPALAAMSQEESDLYDFLSPALEKEEKPFVVGSSVAKPKDAPTPTIAVAQPEEVEFVGSDSFEGQKKGSTGRYGFKLEETLESRSETPVLTSPEVVGRTSPPGEKDLPPKPPKDLPALPPAFAPVITKAEGSDKALGHPLERVTSRDYLEDLITSSGNTTASTRLLRIMQAESVSPASSLGLKLLDLAKALRTDGELAPARPVEDTTTNKKVENIENRLNEFADMLYHIAENVGVASDTSSTASSSVDEDDEDRSTTATVGDVPCGLSFSQLAIAGQQVNKSIDAIQSPYKTNEPLPDTPIVPSARPDLGNLVREAQQLEKEEDKHNHPPKVDQPQDAGEIKVSSTTRQMRTPITPQEQAYLLATLGCGVPTYHSQAQGLSNFSAPPPQFGYSYRPYPGPVLEGPAGFPYAHAPGQTSSHTGYQQMSMVPPSSLYPICYKSTPYSDWTNKPNFENNFWTRVALERRNGGRIIRRGAKIRDRST
ncbi:hypothetical protein I302_106749 [Kwoniella bestiolae CBS 10118]|uniref:Uncharacterized protein n=1 Tax=Kwoniella bestiolae CBS 10118 TaxID=1296100 RepID=A0A1B9G0H9_9TREE|nr:hypothetical protein I302_05985 [Kwoniella bestiolae CBS 10118]OCF24525.1 hypothetical protein I302_05985 [Kwoniella bestiolae CBS 10118]